MANSKVTLGEHTATNNRRAFSSTQPRAIGHVTIGEWVTKTPSGVTRKETRAFVSVSLPCLAEVVVDGTQDTASLQNDAKAAKLVRQGLDLMLKRNEGANVAVLTGFDDEAPNGLVCSDVPMVQATAI